jgi:HSP20 family protein
MVRFGNGYSPWELMRQLDSLQDRLAHVLPEAGPLRPAAYPPLNIRADADSVVVDAELPGVDPQSLDISALRDQVVIRGNRLVAQPQKGQQWHRQERAGGEFARTIQLPYPVDSARVRATYTDGILTVRLPRA